MTDLEIKNELDYVLRQLSNVLRIAHDSDLKVEPRLHYHANDEGSFPGLPGYQFNIKLIREY